MESSLHNRTASTKELNTEASGHGSWKNWSKVTRVSPASSLLAQDCPHARVHSGFHAIHQQPMTIHHGCSHGQGLLALEGTLDWFPPWLVHPQVMGFFTSGNNIWLRCK